MERRIAALAMATVAWLASIPDAAAQAQDRGDVRAFTLKQAFDAAWQRQPDSRSAAARRQAADAQAAVARSWTAEPAALELSTEVAEQAAEATVAGECEAETVQGQGRANRISWARLLKRVLATT